MGVSSKTVLTPIHTIVQWLPYVTFFGLNNYAVVFCGMLVHPI